MHHVTRFYRHRAFGAGKRAGGAHHVAVARALLHHVAPPQTLRAASLAHDIGGAGAFFHDKKPIHIAVGLARLALRVLHRRAFRGHEGGGGTDGGARLTLGERRDFAGSIGRKEAIGAQAGGARHVLAHAHRARAGAFPRRILTLLTAQRAALLLAVGPRRAWQALIQNLHKLLYRKSCRFIL